MTRKTDYLICKVQELAYAVPSPKMNPQSVELYAAYDLKQRLKPQFGSVLNQLDKLSEQLCPQGYAVNKLTLHSSYIAKRHFPRKLISTIGFRSIGSKSYNGLKKIWQIDIVDLSSKIKITERQSGTYYEVGLHLIPEMSTDFIKTVFLKYVSEPLITLGQSGVFQENPEEISCAAIF